METALIGNIYLDSKNGNPIIKSKNNIFYSSFYFQDFYDDTLTKKFIKSTERLIRSSKEYNNYLALLKTNYNILNYDNILSHIGTMDASIEMHHYPFTLYKIVEIVMSHHIVKKEFFTTFSLAKEVMNLHYAQKIGLVPLAITNHELAHEDALFISTKQIFGQWEDFYSEYQDGLSQSDISYINSIKNMSLKNVASDSKGIY